MPPKLQFRLIWEPVFSSAVQFGRVWGWWRLLMGRLSEKPKTQLGIDLKTVRVYANISICKICLTWLWQVRWGRNGLQSQNKCFTIYWLWRQHVATRWFSRTCGWNVVMDPGQRNSNSRWLPPAALASYIYISAGRTTRTALSSKICAGCLRHFKLLACVSSNFWLGPNRLKKY